MKVTFIFVSFLLTSKYCNCVEFKYHSHQELENVLLNFSQNNVANIKSNLFSIGDTTQGKKMWVFDITAASKDKWNEIPHIQLIGNIHGNEPAGREILLHYIQFLYDNFEKNERVTWLLKNTKISILPALNPDGFELAEEGDCEGVKGRFNGNFEDINRNFPRDGFKNETNMEPETLAVMNWMKNNSFVLSVDFHGGALVAAYPYFRILKTEYGYESATSVTPDNKIFEHLATVYVENNERIFKQNPACFNETFENGITRGAEWYFFMGGMQDYGYTNYGTMGLVIEITCCKYPPAQELINIWEENKNALLMLCSEVHKGVTGLVFDARTKSTIQNVNLTILGIDKIFKSNKNGRFWKLLLPGTYYLKAEAEGYENSKDLFFKVENKTEFPELTYIEIPLNRNINVTK